MQCTSPRHTFRHRFKHSRPGRRWLHGNMLTGTIPDAWAGPGSFTVLRELTLSDNPSLTGTLPDYWGSRADCLPELQTVNISGTGLSGPLPPQWGPYPAKLQEL